MAYIERKEDAIVDEKEIDRVEIRDGEITLKSYGLPLIFWGYLGAGLTVLFAMIDSQFNGRNILAAT